MDIVLNDELYHHGIKGQKWGVRRFQNPDGSLTEAGKKRYSYKIEKYGGPDLNGTRKGITFLKNVGKTNISSLTAEYETDENYDPETKRGYTEHFSFPYFMTQKQQKNYFSEKADIDLFKKAVKYFNTHDEDLNNVYWKFRSDDKEANDLAKSLGLEPLKPLDDTTYYKQKLNGKKHYVFE